MLISCLMVTRDRAAFAARAVRCLAAQTWREVELVVVDDGDQDYAPVLGAEHSHLFIRCFHGGNTWDEGHFRKRLRRTPLGAAHYLLARLRGDLRRHPQLRLTPRERDAVATFVAERRALELLRA